MVPGHPRTMLGAVPGVKPFFPRSDREILRRRRIKDVISEPSDQQTKRERRNSAGGRPPKLNREA